MAENAGFAVIGLGRWGEQHLHAYAEAPGVRLVGVCDLNADLARRQAEAYGCPYWTRDYQDLVSRPEVAAVSVATPDFAHFEIVQAALQAGKHVLVEKPLALDSAQAQHLADLAAAADRLLMVDFHNRWNPAFFEVKRRLEAGELGEVQMLSLRLNDTTYVPTEMLGWAAKSSPVWFLGAHTADLVYWLTGDRARRVWAVSRSRLLRERGVDTPDFFQTLIELRGGGVAHMENCWILSPQQPNLFDLKLELVGSAGTAFVDAATNRAVETYSEAGATYPDLLVCTHVHGRWGGFGLESIRHFASCVVGGHPPLVTPEEAVANVRLLEAIHQSAATGEPVTLE